MQTQPVLLYLPVTFSYGLSVVFENEEILFRGDADQSSALIPQHLLGCDLNTPKGERGGRRRPIVEGSVITKIPSQSERASPQSPRRDPPPKIPDNLGRFPIIEGQSGGGFHAQ